MPLVEVGEAFEAGLVDCFHCALIELGVEWAGFEYLECRAHGGVVG